MAFHWTHLKLLGEIRGGGYSLVWRIISEEVFAHGVLGLRR